jgi:CDP-diacylglycerol---glycerol-3-phosphate 3-phosphatidyltransferase
MHEKLRSISYKLAPSQRVEGFQLDWPESNGCPQPYLEPEAYRAHATNLLSPLLRPTKPASTSSASTLVYPLSQLAPLSPSPEDTLSTETTGVGYVLDVLSQPSFQGGKWVFTAGYFNPSDSVKRGLIAGTQTTGLVINASAEANGFYGSANPSGYLPDAYMILARRFLESVRDGGMEGRIKMEEWRHVARGGRLDGWTYHAKGIWIIPPMFTQPILTLIGSSNFTRRSDRLDLESTCVVITADPTLQSSLASEIDNLCKYTSETSISKLNEMLAEGGWRRGLAVRAWVAAVGGKL